MTCCTSIMFYSDMGNPCNGGDPIECAKWKKEYPKEYKNFERRMEKYQKNGKLKTYQNGAKSN